MVNRKAQVGLVFAAVLLFGSLAWAQADTPKVTPVAPPAAGVKAQNPAPAPPGQPQVVIQATPPAQAKPQAAAPAQDPPVMVLAATEFDAGTVNKGDLVKHDFLVENKGKGTLEITHVQPAC
jgi:hypothetical protein